MKTTTRKPTQVTVYWDTQDRDNEGWAFRASDDDGAIASGPIDGIEAIDLAGAINQACHELDLDLTADDFAQEPDTDGGYAVWSFWSEAQ